MLSVRRAEIYNVNCEHVSGTSNVLAVDVTRRYLSEEHLPLAIFASLIFFFITAPTTSADSLHLQSV